MTIDIHGIAQGLYDELLQEAGVANLRAEGVRMLFDRIQAAVAQQQQVETTPVAAEQPVKEETLDKK